MRELLFLDCDGVVNRITPTGYEPPHPGMDSECVLRLSCVVVRLNLQVVISSSWREDHSVEQLKRLFEECSPSGTPIAARIVGATPVLPAQPNRRWLEVQAWRQSHHGTPYVIVDDSKKHGFPADRFVRTNGATGFTVADEERVERILAAQQVAA